MSGDAPWPEDPHERLLKLAHDLRTPLVVVNGFAELLAARGPELPDEQRDEFLSRLVEGAKQLQQILDSERAHRRDAEGRPI